MKETVRSYATGKTYAPSECVRIVNIAQIAAYLEYGVDLLDIYQSKDFETNKRIIVAVFNKKDSFEAYQKWCNHEL